MAIATTVKPEGVVVRQAEAEALGLLHRQLDSVEVRAAISLLRARAANALGKMRSCSIDDLPAARAEWAQLDKLADEIQRGPVVIPTRMRD